MARQLENHVNLAIAHNVADAEDGIDIIDILKVFGDFTFTKKSTDGRGKQIAFGHFSEKKNALTCVTSLNILQYVRPPLDARPSVMFLIQARTDFRGIHQPDPFIDIEVASNPDQKRAEVRERLDAATVYKVGRSYVIPDTGEQCMNILDVSSVLPMPGYETRRDYLQSISSSMNRKPIDNEKIRLWNGFAGEVEDDKLAGFEKSKDTASFVENANSFYIEDAVKIGFTTNVCGILRNFLLEDEVFGYHNIDPNRIPGEPDYLFRKDEVTLIVFEMKAARFKTSDIVADYKHRDINVRSAVDQLHGHMLSYDTKFGVLSTYDNTWFARFFYDDDGEGGKIRIVEVSHAIPWDSTEPTVIHAMAHLIALARADYNQRPKETPKDGGGGAAHQVNKETRKPSAEGPPKTPRRSPRLQGLPAGSTEPDKSGARNQSMGPVVILQDDIRFDKVVGRGRSGKVISGCWRGETVALKLYELRKKRGLEVDLGNELAAYAALDAIQGESIPLLKAHGFFGASRYIMVLEMIGFGEQIVPSTLTADEIGKIEHIFEVIHQLGVLHGDVRSANILRWGSRFYVVDFGFADPHCSSAEDFCKEMNEVRSLLSGQRGDYY